MADSNVDQPTVVPEVLLSNVGHLEKRLTILLDWLEKERDGRQRLKKELGDRIQRRNAIMAVLVRTIQEHHLKVEPNWIHFCNKWEADNGHKYSKSKQSKHHTPPTFVPSKDYDRSVRGEYLSQLKTEISKLKGEIRWLKNKEQKSRKAAEEKIQAFQIEADECKKRCSVFQGDRDHIFQYLDAMAQLNKSLLEFKDYSDKEKVENKLVSAKVGRELHCTVKKIRGDFEIIKEEVGGWKMAANELQLSVEFIMEFVQKITKPQMVTQTNGLVRVPFFTPQESDLWKEGPKTPPLPLSQPRAMYRGPFLYPPPPLGMGGESGPVLYTPPTPQFRPPYHQPPTFTPSNNTSPPPLGKNPVSWKDAPAPFPEHSVPVEKGKELEREGGDGPKKFGEREKMRQERRKKLEEQRGI